VATSKGAGEASYNGHSAGGAIMPESSHAESPAVTFIRTVPILRIFSVEKAKEFYCGFLGFNVDWEHTFEPNTPVYMQISRSGLRLHLSEHHGDGSPGIHIHVEMTGVDEFHREVTSKDYKYLRPGIQDEFYGARSMNVIDPFGNRISFNEFKQPRE
jgi:catechol 2,3-dioxygenase-like lactoylglutathione lyase family enzyme